MSQSKTYIIAILAIGIIGAGVFFFNANAEDKKKVVEEEARPVKTLVLTRNSHTATRSFPGKVRASERVDLSFEVGGLLTDLPIRDGLRVKKGQLLAKLDQRNFKNNVLSAEAAFTEAKLHYERTQKLISEKIVAVSVLDKSKSSYDRALAQLEITKKALSDTELRAPFDGIIAREYVNNHQKVAPTQVILSLQDMTNIEITIQVPESIMVYATKDDLHSELKVKFDAISNREFDASVHEYSVDADSQTQTYDVVLTMPTSSEFNFLPGMTATVTSANFIKTTEENLNTIWLPSPAVQGEEEGNKTFVFVITPDNRAKKKYIEIGDPTDSGIPVISGLETGERVIIAGCSYLRDGMLVRAL